MIKIKNWVWKMFGGTRRTEIAALVPEGERLAAYLSAPGSALLAAVLADLDELAVTVSDRALDIGLSNEHLRWHTGGQDALLEFKEKLLARVAEARLTQEQREAKAREEQTNEDNEG